MAADAVHEASMLLAFRIENVRSFRDPTEFSLLAGGRAASQHARQIEWRADGAPLSVLPVGGLFGGNASGKSGLLEAMDDMRMYVLESFRRDIAAREHWPFGLDLESADKPSLYEIELVLHGVRHQYGFLIDRDHVVEEWAYRYPYGRAAMLFRRSGHEVEAGTAAAAETRNLAKIMRPNSLFLSAAGAAAHSLLGPLYDWFRRNMTLAHARNRPQRQAFTVEMLLDDDRPDRVLKMLRAADLGIVGAKKHDLDPKVKAQMGQAIRILLGEESAVEDSEIEARLDLDGFGFSLIHQADQAHMELPPGWESQGTVVWLGLIGPVIAALDAGTVMLADELDASLHPALVAQVIRLFQDRETNQRRAQLIFNAHDPMLLGDVGSDQILDRDQIWFTEKEPAGNTTLYPLTAYKPRKYEAIVKRYLSGRYGAVPILSDDEFDAAAELVEAGE